MSTKTLRKRIALVAVSALGFGLMSVVPASANLTGTVTARGYLFDSTTVASAGDYSASLSTVFTKANPVLIYVDAAGFASSATKLYADVTATPDSAVSVPFRLGTAASPGTTFESGWQINGVATDIFHASSAVVTNATFGSGAATVANVNDGIEGPVAGTDADAAQLWITPTTMTKTGSYTVRIWGDTDGNGTYSSTDPSTEYSFTAAGTVTKASITAPALVPVVAGTNNITVDVRFSDADSYGAPAPSSMPTLKLASAAAVDQAGTGIGSLAIPSGAPILTGLYRATVNTNAAGASNASLTAQTYAWSVGSLTGTASTVVMTPMATANQVVEVGISNTTGVAYGKTTSPIATAGGTDTITVDPSVTTLSFVVEDNTAQAGKYQAWKVTTSNTSRVAPSTTTNWARIANDGKFGFIVTNAAPVAGDSYTVAVYGNGNADTTAWATYTVTYAKAAPKLTILSPSAGVKVVNGGSVNFTVKATDVFGAILANQPMTVTVSGRNSLSTTITSDASGLATYTFTDAGTTPLATSDTVTFNATNASGSATARTYSVTYIATAIAVGDIVTTTSAATATIDQQEVVSTEPASGTITLTATLRTSTGLPVTSGVLVTFAGASADDKFVAGINTGVTDASGVAKADVYRNKTGTTTYTASAGGKSSVASTPVKFSNTDTTHARSLAVSTSSASAPSEGVIRITASVTDRWGNPVALSKVNITENGAGRLYAGETVQKTTDSTGTASWDITSLKDETGTNTVSVALDSTTLGNSLDLAGFVAGAAVAGVDAGKPTSSVSIEFTKNTSTSTADALLALATALGTRDQASAAVDAAAEATDAANAATDAANAAAEAADAATAAAQDAADAVAALSTQVSEMVAALKKQITSLTNLVIKIQKKVKA